MDVEKTTLWLATSSPELVSGLHWNLTANSRVFIEVRTYSISPGHPLVSRQHLSRLPCVPHQDVSGNKQRGGRCGGHTCHILTSCPGRFEPPRRERASRVRLTRLLLQGLRRESGSLVTKGCSFNPQLLLTPPSVSRCLPAPDELAVALHAAICRRCVNVCMKRCKSLCIKASAKYKMQ